MKKVKVIFINLLMLTVTSLILRTVNISFQVYLSNRLGPQGMGLFQLITSIYFLAIIFSISGIKFATTRLVAEEMGTGKPAGAIKAVQNCLAYGAIFSITSMIIVNLNSEYIGTCWLNDTRTILSLRIFAFSLPFISLSSVLNGYFIAVRKVIKTVAVQYLEQLIKIGATILCLVIFLPKGLEYACAAVVLGACVGEFGSFLFLFLLYSTDRTGVNNTGQVGPHLLSRMLHIALPVAFSAYIVAIVRTIQQLLIPYGLKKSGESSEAAISTFGVIQGMTMPVIMFPSVLLDAISDLIVPELAECKASNSCNRLNYIIARVFNLGVLLSIGVTWLFWRFSKELGMTIYNNTDAAYFIMMLAPLIPVMYLDNIVDNMLKGIDEQVSSMRYNMFTSLINVVMTYLLLPRYAITGYIITTYFTKTLNFALSLNRLIRVTNLRIDVYGIVKSILCIIGAIGITVLLKDLNLVDPTLIYLHLLLTAAIYIFLLRVFSCITHDDVIWVKSLFK
ncbi:MAG TPA: oligosaccharide flippase family protein [Syntrophomonadaceae bacterium]|nr:oligosaccharide flippase family protein [Syntrophomonadaceae bacterium]